MAALGAETPEGDFEVLQVCYAGLPPQPEHKPVTEQGEWVALTSGLEMGGAADAEDMRVTLLAEWLLGDLGLDEVSLSNRPCLGEAVLTVSCWSKDTQEAAKVTRLIIAGNGLAQPTVDLSDATKTVSLPSTPSCPRSCTDPRARPPETLRIRLVNVLGQANSGSRRLSL